MASKTPYLGDVSERFFRDKLRRAGLRITRGRVLGAPLLADCMAAVEARLMKTVDVGDHELFVGRIEAAYADVEEFDNMWKLEKYRPLMYLERTKRPGPVHRVYVTPKGFEKIVLEYAPGELKEATEKRIKVMEEVKRAVRESAGREEALEK